MATILQILPKLHAGGVERGTIEIAKKIIAEGHQAIIVSSGGHLVHRLLKTGATHIELDVASKNPIKIFLASRKLRKIIKTHKIKIVHARSRVPAWCAYLAINDKKVKFLTTFHGIYSGKSFLKKFYNSIMLKSDHIIAVTHFIKKHIKENYNFQDDKKITVIHRGVDLNEFDPKKANSEKALQYLHDWHIPDDKKVILMPGRVTSWKGHELFIEALSQVKNDDYYAIIVGDSSKHANYRKKLENLISEKKLEDKITIQDNVPDIANLYQISYMVISASLRPEPFGRTIVEAAAMQKIVIATKHGGATETIIDGTTGFLVSSTESNQMAARIDGVLTLSKKNKNMIEKNARNHVIENFSLEKMQDKTMKIYKKLLRK